jgi:hypothetical protein
MTTIIIGILIGIAIWSGLFGFLCIIDKADEEWAQGLMCGIWALHIIAIVFLKNPINKIRVHFFKKKYNKVVVWQYKNGRKVNGQRFYVHKKLLKGIKADETFEISPCDRVKTIPEKELIITDKEFIANLKKGV